MFVISTSNENGKLSCVCSISIFIYHQSKKWEISSFTLQIYFDRFSCFFNSPGYSLLRQTKLILEKSIFLIRTHYSCYTSQTLLNKLAISKWFLLFCNQICYHITSFCSRVCLTSSVLKKILLR